MITIDLSEVSALAPHLQPGSREPVILTRGGRPWRRFFPPVKRTSRTSALYECAVSNDPGAFATTLRSGGRHQQHGSAGQLGAAPCGEPRSERVNCPGKLEIQDTVRIIDESGELPVTSGDGGHDGQLQAIRVAHGSVLQGVLQGRRNSYKLKGLGALCRARKHVQPLVFFQ